MNPDPVFSFELQAIATDQQYRNITALARAVQTRVFGNRHPSFAPSPLLQCVRFMLIKAKVPDFMYSDETKVVMDFFFDPTIFRNVEPPPVDAVVYKYPTGRLKVAIVGGGPTALASAISLAEKGAGKIQVHVYERRWVVMTGLNGQTRYLLNASDFDGRGYLNMQLTEEEWHKMLAMDGQPVTFGYPGCLRRPDGTIPPGFNDNQVFAPSENRGGSLWRSISDGLKLFGFKESEVINVVRIPIVVQAVREGIQYLPPSDSASINRPHALVAVAGDAAMTVHFWPGRGLNSGVKSGIALGDEIVHALNAGKFVGLPLTAMQQYNDFIMKLQDREHDKRSIPILNQSGTPETLGWLLSKANTVPDNVAIEWLVGAMSQIAERLEQRGDWAFQPVANVEPQLRIVLRQLDSETLREMAVSFPWPTREMGGAEVLPLRSMKPEEKQRWLQQLWGLLRDEAPKKPASRGDQGRASRFEAPRGAALLPPRATSPSPQFLTPDSGNPTPNRSESTLRRSNASRAMYSPRIGDGLDSLDTPSMIVNLDLMESNIKKLFDNFLPTGRKVRPHLKTTKSAVLARKLVAAGATGCCVAKVSEAEAITAAGFDDILITCEIIGAPKVKRLVELFRKHRDIRIVVDSEVGATAINDALAQSGIDQPITTLIDLDVGLHRTGVAPGEPALALAKHIATLPHLRLIGVQGYEGHLQHLHDREDRKKQCLESMKTLVDTAEQLRKEGFTIDVVTTGGTGTGEFCAQVPGVTELQPGSFIFMDTDYRNAVGTFYSNSLTLLATVVSKQGERQVTIDTGLKSLTTDSGLAECKDPRYRHANLGDEHGSLTWDEGTPALNVGDRVEMIPSHIDPTINLHDFYYAHRNGVIEEIWTVDSRGKVQ
ncbi:D-threonine aldolase [Colletotrichum gloeosporioides]|uniref:D-threonine aldolase n=2 Tax=Colletotrichum gloeosporioides TaxID=474922 RepID=A0A8H4FKI2_COLGL|nr:D-threonine aldolase [Colletotrichum gloeosporioides]KAF3804274.1 D-threonine aldolase [Colletotrichum gloeosporioides]